MMTGAGYRLGGAIITVVGIVIFAITQTAATTTPDRTSHYTHRAFIGAAGTLVTVGIVVLALGIIRGWFVGSLIYVHRPEREGQEGRAEEDAPVQRRHTPRTRRRHRWNKPQPDGVASVDGDQPDANVVKLPTAETIRALNRVARRIIDGDLGNGKV